MIKIFNTLSKKKEEFKPLEKGKVGMYVCGPTPYDHSHIGHARSEIFFDVARKWLEHEGFEVKFVTNFTDVDDKIIDKAKKLKISPFELSKSMIEEHLKEREELKIKKASNTCLVSEHIQDIINLIQRILDNGFGYVVDGNVFFEVKKFKNYGKFSGQSVEDLIAGARVEVNEKKRNPEDFTLWKAWKEGEPFWESPWGKGRPGWHIECSAMSIKYLGESFDIHGGGNDLIFPHHENEIAQSEAATGKKFCNYWMHNGMVTIKKEKMSKSLGNFITIKDALKKNNAETIRLVSLSTKYEEPAEISEEVLETAENNVNKFNSTIQKLESFSIKNNKKHEEVERLSMGFENAMNDDFNIPEALKFLYELKNLGEKALIEGDKNLAWSASEKLKEFGDVLGIIKKEKKPGKEVLTLIKEREEARKQNDFKKSDELRKKILEKGFVVEDTSFGSVWSEKFY
jgi:cysteinyl-tRNA synthetase